MKNLWLFIEHNFYPLLLIAIGALLCAANYSPNTILSGWDTLHPEFNFSLAFERMLNGVWRYDQGLGAVAGHSHMADLPRVAFLWLLHFGGVPTSMLRYIFMFLMLIAGPLGVYFLTKKILDSCFRRNDKKSNAATFIAGLAYLCNLGTLQQFIVPFDMFIVCYGILPWLFLTGTWYIQKSSRWNFLAFTMIVVAITPMAYAATLWYTTMLGFFLYIVLIGGLKRIKQILIILFAIICLNAYWILPNIYFTVTHGQEVRDAKVNQLFSPEAFAKNQAFGTVENAALFKNFLFDWTIYNPQKGQFDDLMDVWKQHLAIPGTQAIGYFIFGLAVLGILTIFVEFLEGRTLPFDKLRVNSKVRPCKNTIEFALIPVFLLGFLALLSGTWPITILFEKIQNIAPIAGEALRFPFTKFSILFMVPFAVFVGIGFQAVLVFAKTKFLQTITITEMTLVLLAFFLPAFTGHLIHPAMRIQIPKEYFQMFEWFSKQNKTDRVAILPIHTFWNWTYYQWGYQGAGFLQFGIPQPILDRDYDRWNVTNETYQKEMSYAVYSQQPDLIRQVLNKYDIRWVLLDTSVIAPGENKNITFTWRLPELLEQTGLTTMHQFGDTITIFKVQTQDITSMDIPLVNSSAETLPLDTIYTQIGSYATLPSTRPSFTKDQRIDRFTESIQGEVIEERQLIGYKQEEVFSVSFSTLSHANAYVVSITSKNNGGFPMQLCISNDLTKHCELFTRLHWGSDIQTEQFLILPFIDYSVGYTLNFKNDTIGNKKGENSLQTIAVSRINWPIGQAEIVDQIPTYVFSQSFDKGWRAYTIQNSESRIQNWLNKTFPFLFGKEVKDSFDSAQDRHVMVNNWSNGWMLQKTENGEQKTDNTNPSSVISPQSSVIVLFFLPQLLEWFGFALLPIPFLILLLKK